MNVNTLKDGSPVTRFGRSLSGWFDNSAVTQEAGDAKHIDWLRVVPYFALHLGRFGVLWVGWSWTAVGVALTLYAVRMLAITGGFYHRYFSHKAFRTSRAMAVLVRADWRERRATRAAVVGVAASPPPYARRG